MDFSNYLRAIALRKSKPERIQLSIYPCWAVGNFTISFCALFEANCRAEHTRLHFIHFDRDLFWFWAETVSDSSDRISFLSSTIRNNIGCKGMSKYFNQKLIIRVFLFGSADCICARWRDNLLETICFMHLGQYQRQSYSMHKVQRIERQWKIHSFLSCMPIQGKTIHVVRLLLIFAEYRFRYMHSDMRKMSSWIQNACKFFIISNCIALLYAPALNIVNRRQLTCTYNI